MRTFEETIYSGPAGPPGGYETPSDPGRRPGDRDARRASLLLLPGIPLALIAGAFWAFLMNTSTFGDHERLLIEGWKGVVLNLPAYLLVVAVGFASLACAARARRLCAGRNLGGLVASAAGLLFVLGAVTRSAANVVMTTSATTATWLLFVADVAVVALVARIAHRWAARHDAAQPGSGQTVAD